MFSDGTTGVLPSDDSPPMLVFWISGSITTRRVSAPPKATSAVMLGSFSNFEAFSAMMTLEALLLDGTTSDPLLDD
jgi:hypothetical protein